MNILVVEDDAPIRDSIVELLEDEGYQVESATNGKEALELLNAARELPSLIILDITMPVMNGYEFRKIQLADSKLAAIPTALCSADGQLLQKAQVAGITEWLKKPLNLDSLLELAQRYSSRSP